MISPLTSISVAMATIPGSQDIMPARAWLPSMSAAHSSISGPLARASRSASGVSRTIPCRTTTAPSTVISGRRMGIMGSPTANSE